MDLPRSSVINQIPMPPVKPPRDPKRDEDLVKMLLTCDGAGKAAKKEALAELLARAAFNTWQKILNLE